MARRTSWGTTTWYAIVSSSMARIIEHERGRRLRLIRELPCEEEVPDAGVVADMMRPRRFRPASSTMRQLARDTFLADVASELKRCREHGLFDRLVLVGPPAVLRRLHLAMDPGTRAMVSGELFQDLSMLPITGLQRHLGVRIPR